MPQQAKYKFIGCEIIYREACYLAAAGLNQVDLHFLRKGLHDLKTQDMNACVQEAIDAVDASQYEAVLLGYGRCNDALVGVRAGSVPLVIPKAHDCITLFFGSRYAYMDYFQNNPGTYFMTTGWSERSSETGDDSQLGMAGVMASLGLNESYEQLVADYGADNAEFIRQSLGDWRSNYRQMLYLEMGICDEGHWIKAAKSRARENNWRFSSRKGNWTLLRKLFSGQWDDDFVVVPPGGEITARNDEHVLDFRQGPQ